MSSKSIVPSKDLEGVELPALTREEDARLNAMASEDIADEVGAPLDEVIAWVESWGSPDELPTPKAARPELRDAINATLEAAIAEAERVGYVSAEEAERRAEELLQRLDAEAAAGRIKP